MSILACCIPDFLLALHQQSQQTDQPLALLGPDERVWAVSSSARKCGVAVQMSPRQAQVHCPDVKLHPLDLADSQAAQHTLLAELARWELPVEEQQWGAAYVDLHAVTTMPNDVRALAAEAGRRVRAALGERLAPAIGWDSGKFTARAAALCVPAGRMRLVGKADEARFLAPLPITLLPLPEQAQQQLHWLGIHTLGQFGGLPATAVWQRFGQTGKLAQRWAQGRDDRPVVSNLHTTSETISVDIDPPSGQIGRVMTAVMDALRPVLQRLAAQLRGCHRLRVRVKFVQGSTSTADIVFVEPVCQQARLHNAIEQRLQAFNWPAQLAQIDVTLLSVSDLPAGQLALFSDPLASGSPLIELAQKLTRRYGPRMLQGVVIDADHPIAARRIRLELSQV